VIGLRDGGARKGGDEQCRSRDDRVSAMGVHFFLR
jgi:hypothetical protein